MNIVIDARMYGLENTGIGRYTIGLVNGLKKIKTDHKYFVLLRTKYFKRLNFPSNWEKILADFGHYSLGEQFALPKLIKSLNPNLTHFVHFNVPLFYNGPFVVTIHDLLMHRQKGIKATTLPAPIYFTKRLGYKAVFSHAVKDSLKVIAPSQAVKGEIVDYYKIPPDKVRVTYEGIDIPNVTVDETRGLSKYALEKKGYFIYVGNAYPHKNLTRAIKAVASLNKNSPQKYLLAIVCARNVFTRRLQKEVEALKAEKFVKLLGFVPDSELGTLYNNSLAFVFPTLSEGFGLPGLEAMLSGTVACVSNIPVLKETYGDNVVYFDPYNVSEIKKALIKVIKMNEAERKGLIEKSQRFAKRYSWDKMTEQTLKIYEDCARLRQSQ